MRRYGTVWYHDPNERDPAIHIDVGGVVGHRTDPPLVAHRVALHDARTRGLVFDEDGVLFTHDAAVPDLEASRDAYDAALTALLVRTIGAAEVVVFDHTERVDAVGPRPPARHAHNDCTSASAWQRLRDLLDADRAEVWAAGHYGIVNVWRPLAPVERAPLAFARARSVSPLDWLDVRIVYPDREGRIAGLLPAPAHEWVYAPDMQPDEVAVFRVHDSAGLPIVGHTAVDVEGTPPNAAPRRSLESRTFVRYA